ncbi:hypothetical protein NA57DRAFT_73842 [Rhizodiscina lignyota]|uniref:Uncharacterized protein n=1 Tax=Rhizodiscina lignyota TaxID=1504668 RepID=A0A9P4IKN4_9PEZI|nr:hypothetical protein NA57DRAFT_73842 [Rhizodiscina lignyota]
MFDLIAALNFSVELVFLLKMHLLSLLPLFLLSCLSSANAQGLNVTAISASGGHSVLECWSLSAPPLSFAGASNYPIGNYEGSYVGVIAPRTHIGQAWAMHPQHGSLFHNVFSIFLSGLVHIRLPDSRHEAWVQGGKYGIIIAADTKNLSMTGHVTDFPGNDETVIAELPFAGGMVPDHEVLYAGPCKMKDLIGI